jgi:phosphoribosylformylglycinamidine synthase
MATLAFKAAGEAILLIGGHGEHLGQSIFLREILGREEGAPPPVDLARERRHGDLVRSLIRSGQVTAVHDISDGGLAACLIEMALASKTFGAAVHALDHLALFAEDQARYVVTCRVPSHGSGRGHR